MSTPALPSLNARARTASKWSLLTEVLARVITPVTQLMLARILAPDAFGVVATVLMVTSFAEMIADGGFQKFLIQRHVKDEKQLRDYANVAFWSSMTIALALFGLITIFRDPLAALAGNPEIGHVLVVSSAVLPLTVFSSTQTALFRRALEYKKLLPIRVAAAVSTLVVALPLALVGADYWALVAGILVAALVMAASLTVASPWRPGRFYSFTVLREMFSLSGWSLLEAMSIWLATWAGVFVVSSVLSSHELGLYRQPVLVVTSMFAVITAATTPILFASLSRLQDDLEEFRGFFFRFQFNIAIFVLPIGVGAFFFRDLLTQALFGPQWSEAALMFGVWALSSGFMIPLSHYCSEVYRSLGRPQISLLSQVLYISVMVPALYLAALDGFTTLVLTAGLVRIVQIAINQILTYLAVRIGFLQVARNLYVPLLALIPMVAAAAWLAPRVEDSWLLTAAAILACALVYGAVCLCFSRARDLLLSPLSSLRQKRRLS